MDVSAAKTKDLKQVPTLAGHLPVVGDLASFFWKLPETLASIPEGESKLRRIKMPGQPVSYLWLDPKAFDLFRNKVTTSDLGDQPGIDLTLGQHSMLNTDGPVHRRRRKSSSHPFTPSGMSMSGVSTIIEEEVLKRAETMASAKSIVLLEETQGLALDIIFRIMGIPEDELEIWGQKYSALLMGALGPKRSIPGLPYHKGKKAREWLDTRLQGYIERARSGELTQGLVAELVQGRDDSGSGMNDAEILDNLRLVILAGHETTASVMAWMASYLATHETVWDRLVAEVRSQDGLPRSPKDMSRYPYSEALFRESLRLNPPASVLNRLTTEPMVIEGFDIPVGTSISLPIYLIARDPNTYDDPNTFNPERWMGEKKRITPIETAPFGGGPHFCLGYHMAWVESVQFIVALTRALDERGLRLNMARLPKANYLPLTRPRGKETRCVIIPNPNPAH